MPLLPVSRRTGKGAKGFILALGVPHEGGIINELGSLYAAVSQTIC